MICHTQGEHTNAVVNIWNARIVISLSVITFDTLFNHYLARLLTTLHIFFYYLVLEGRGKGDTGLDCYQACILARLGQKNVYLGLPDRPYY